MTSDPGFDELSRNLMLRTMAEHRVREMQTMVTGYRWTCSCGASHAGTAMTPAEHQAQAVLDALRRYGWSAPDPIRAKAQAVIDGSLSAME